MGGPSSSGGLAKQEGATLAVGEKDGKSLGMVLARRDPTIPAAAPALSRARSLTMTGGPQRKGLGVEATERRGHTCPTTRRRATACYARPWDPTPIDKVSSLYMSSTVILMGPPDRYIAGPPGVLRRRESSSTLLSSRRSLPLFKPLRERHPASRRLVSKAQVEVALWRVPKGPVFITPSTRGSTAYLEHGTRG